MVGVVLPDTKFLAQSHSFLRILNMFLFFLAQSSAIEKSEDTLIF